MITVDSKGTAAASLITCGRYILPDIVPALAMWISPSFLLKACRILNDYISQRWRENFELLQKRMDELEMELEEKSKKADLFDKVQPDVAPKTCNKSLWEVFRLVKLNNPDHQFHYATTRCQKRCTGKSLKSIVKKHPKALVVLEIGYTPNSMNLQNRFKESLSMLDDEEGKKVKKMKGNEIEVADEQVEETLIDHIKQIAASLM